MAKSIFGRFDSAALTAIDIISNTPTARKKHLIDRITEDSKTLFQHTGYITLKYFGIDQLSIRQALQLIKLDYPAKSGTLNLRVPRTRFEPDQRPKEFGYVNFQTDTAG